MVIELLSKRLKFSTHGLAGRFVGNHVLGQQSLRAEEVHIKDSEFMSEDECF